VYRHDNGADTYEIFNFLASQQELFHIFDNYRRGRSTFTLTGATSRIMDRYLGKMRDGAKGLGLQRNFLSLLGTTAGYSGEGVWKNAAKFWYPESIVASTLVFDHLTRNAQRPSTGPHGLQEDPWFATLGEAVQVLYPTDQDVGLCGQLFGINFGLCTDAGTIPDGAYATTSELAGGFAQMSPGGKVLENRLDEEQGEYGSDYLLNAGSYYDKIWMSMMMTESVDNFISESRGDFLDKRYRSVSLADLFPEGYRRWLANNLTNDSFLKGPRIAAAGPGSVPETDDQGYWADGIGWTKWWGDEVESCFPKNGTNVCSAYNYTDNLVDTSDAPAYTLAIDPEFGWEVQKFLVTWTYIYLPENQKAWWRNQMKMYHTTVWYDDTNLEDKLYFHSPEGGYYVANRFGKEEIFGKTVEMGVSARVLEYANELLNKAYQNTPVDNDGDSVPDWYEPVMGGEGEYLVKFDPSVGGAGYNTGTGEPMYPDDCDEDDESGCTCDMNRYCVELRDYITVLDWMADWSGFADYDTDDWNDMIGIIN